MHEKRPSDLVALEHLWHRWSGVVASSVEPSHMHQKVCASEYDELHAALLAAIERQHATYRLDDGGKKLFHHMEEVCRPWVSLESIRTADKHILRDVLNRARGMDRHLVGDHHLRRPLLVAVVAAACLGVGICLYVFHDDLKTQLVGDASVETEIRALGWKTWYALQRFTPLQWTGALVLVVVGFGVWMMRSTKQF